MFPEYKYFPTIEFKICKIHFSPNFICDALYPSSKSIVLQQMQHIHIFAKYNGNLMEKDTAAQTPHRNTGLREPEE